MGEGWNPATGYAWGCTNPVGWVSFFTFSKGKGRKVHALTIKGRYFNLQVPYPKEIPRRHPVSGIT